MTDAALGDRVVSGAGTAGRFDLAVSAVAGISRAHAQRLISDGRATVDGRRARASDRLAGGETIRVELSAPPDSTIVPESIPLSIVYEDAEMLIVDKPAGLVVHPAQGNRTGTLVHALLGRARDRGETLGSIAGVERPGIVHRLDKETSGLMAVAKTDAAQASLMDQFRQRTVEKEYVALVRGSAPAMHGRIEAPVGRATGAWKMGVTAEGRASITEYEVLDSGAGHSLLALHPLTGRTHQIRAHLAFLHLPIVGDLRYGGGLGPGGLDRQFLHAARLALRRPRDDAPVRAWSALPPDLEAALEMIGLKSDRLPLGAGAEAREPA
ncbi:MAG: RluA family pseudouridine synthase [Chloroflexota bacterium]|nr:RluA family pseudouridine synthase [Chloroflexota bacterium]